MKKLFYVTMLFSTLLIIGCIPTPGTTVIDKTNWIYEYYYNSQLQYVDSTGSGIRDSAFTYPLSTASYPQGYSHQNYKIAVPSQINLKPSDGLRLVVRSKNESISSDMNLVFFSSDLPVLECNWNGSTSYKYFCLLRVDTVSLHNISNMNVSTSDGYHTYEVLVNATDIKSVRDGVEAATLTHNIELNKRVDKIAIVPTNNRTNIDWVKLYKGSKLIMTEDFNTAGQTTAKWTLP